MSSGLSALYSGAPLVLYSVAIRDCSMGDRELLKRTPNNPNASNAPNLVAP